MKYKVGILMNTASVGGAEHVAFNIIRKLRELDIEVVVVAGTRGLLFYEIANICEAHHINNPTTEQLAEVFSNCTVVLNNNWWSLNEIMSPLVDQLGFKYMAAIHGPYLPYLNNVMRHDHLFHEYLSFSPMASKMLVHFGVNPRKIRQQRIPAKTPSVVKNDYTTRIAREMIGLSTDAHVVGITSRISPEKGILDALDIFETYHSIKESAFVILGGHTNNFGGSKYFDRVISRVTELRKKGIIIEITGDVLPNTVEQLQCAFDISINTSQTEGMSLTMSELLSAGIPCVFPDYPDVGLGIDFDQKTRSKYVVPVRHRNLHEGEQRLSHEEKTAYVKAMIMLEEIEQPIAPFPIDETLSSICSDIIDGPFIMTLLYHPPIEWFREMTESILNQNFKCFRWVIVNDGVTNLDILEHLHQLANDQRVTILVHETNKNIREAQNTALRHMYSNGKRMMMIFDSDDIAHPDLLGTQFRRMIESNMTVLGVQLKMFGNNTMITKHPADVTAEMVRENRIYPYWFMNNPGVAIWLDNLGERLYPKTVIPASSDYAMWISLLKDGYVLNNRPDILVHYRVMGKNSTDRLSTEQKNVRVAQLEVIKNQLYEN